MNVTRQQYTGERIYAKIGLQFGLMAQVKTRKSYNDENMISFQVYMFMSFYEEVNRLGLQKSQCNAKLTKVDKTHESR